MLILFNLKNMLLIGIKDKLKTFNEEIGMKWLYLSLIIFVAFLLRVIKLDKIPLGLYSDEALFGYHSFCLAETGRDQDGNLFPVFFKIFAGVHSGGVYYYCAALINKLLGPSIFSIRFTSCLLGLISIFFTYKLVKLYFNKPEALVCAFLLTISPWHIQISRVAMEQSSLVCFFVISVYLFSLGLRGNDKYIIFSSIPIGLSFYSYVIARLFVPLFYFIFLLLNCEKLKEKKKSLFICLLICLIMMVPFVKYSLKYDLQNRYNYLSITNKQFSIEPAKKEFKKLNLSFLTENNCILVPAIFIKNYFKHMSTNFLLKNGDKNLRHHVGGRGQILEFTFWMSIVGFFYLIFKKQKGLYIFSIWLLLFPVPASLTWESVPHALRAVCGLPIFDILAAVGFVSLLSLIRKLLESKNKVIGVIISIFLLFLIIRGVSDFKNYLEDFYIDYPVRSANSFDYRIYAISNATKDMKDIDFFLLPFEYDDVSFRYLQKVSPRKWLKKEYFSKYVPSGKNYYYNRNKKVARIAKLGSFPEERTIGQIKNELTGDIIYEIKLLKSTRK